MGSLSLLKSCLISALDRIYLQEKWMGDQHLVTILLKNYGLPFTNKRYINRYLSNIFIEIHNSNHIRLSDIFFLWYGTVPGTILNFETFHQTTQ